MSFQSTSRPVRWAIWSVIVLAMLWPIGALAQETPPTLQSLTIELWPEFDREGVLVIYEGVLTPAESGAAQEISLLLPSGSEINAVAYLDPATGALQNTDYESLPIGDQTRVTLTAQADNFWVEFYTPPRTISQDGDTRSFSHTWSGDLAVGQITWKVQQPATASDLTVDPSGGQLGTDPLGLPLYTLTTEGTAAGDSATVSVSYNKTDDVLTADRLDSPLQQTGEPGLEQAASSTRAPLFGEKNPALPIVLAVLGVALLTGGIFAYSRSGRSAPDSGPVEKPAARPGTTRAQRAAVQRQVTAGFCTNCGNALQPGDKFCRECGTPVRQ